MMVVWGEGVFQESDIYIETEKITRVYDSDDSVDCRHCRLQAESEYTSNETEYRSVKEK